MFEIGNSIREARLRRGIEIAQAEQVTKIRGKYLRALEDEQFGVLPSQTYVKGFLRTYAEYLGLDGQLYVDEYNSRFVTGEDAEPGLRRSRARPEPRAKRLETNIVLVALAAIAVITIIVISAWKSSGKQAEAPLAPKKVVAAHVKKVPSPPTLVVRAVAGPSYAAIHRGGPSGPVVFAGTITKGHLQQFTGARFWLTVSSPENLQIKVRGKPIYVSGYRPSDIVVTPTTWHAS